MYTRGRATRTAALALSNCVSPVVAHNRSHVARMWSLLWMGWAALALLRLIILVLWADRKKNPTNWVPWRSVAHTCSVLLTCVTLTSLNVSNAWAIFLYLTTIFTEIPIPRAIFMLAMLVTTLGTSIHAVILVGLAALVETTMALVWIFLKMNGVR